MSLKRAPMTKGCVEPPFSNERATENDNSGAPLYLPKFHGVRL